MPSARPYMGEESTTDPPLPNNVRSTSANGDHSSEDDPTSKVCQVPHPITGSGSPDEGMGRVCTSCSAASDGWPDQPKASAAAAHMPEVRKPARVRDWPRSGALLLMSSSPLPAKTGYRVACAIVRAAALNVDPPGTESHYPPAISRSRRRKSGIAAEH